MSNRKRKHDPTQLKPLHFNVDLRGKQFSILAIARYTTFLAIGLAVAWHLSSLRMPNETPQAAAMRFVLCCLVVPGIVFACDLAWWTFLWLRQLLADRSSLESPTRGNSTN